MYSMPRLPGRKNFTTFLMVNLGYISGTIVTIANKHVVADFLIAKTPPAFKKPWPFSVNSSPSASFS